MALGADVVNSDSWGAICDAPESADTNWNQPGSITRSDQHRFVFNPLFYEVDLRLKYDDGLTSITDPVIAVWGYYPDTTWSDLTDSSGTHKLTLATDTSNDFWDGTYLYTDPVTIRARGSGILLCCVETALSATGTVNTSEIQARGRITGVVR